MWRCVIQVCSEGMYSMRREGVREREGEKERARKGERERKRESRESKRERGKQWRTCHPTCRLACSDCTQ